MHPAYVGHACDTSGGPQHDPSFNGTIGGGGLIAFQTAPAPKACVWQVAQSAHSGTIQAGMGDGSVRGVRTSVSQAT